MGMIISVATSFPRNHARDEMHIRHIVRQRLFPTWLVENGNTASHGLCLANIA
jgi:hypothetical protein